MTINSIANLCYMCLFLVIYDCVSGQDLQLQKKLACIEKEDCGACLNAGLHCRWCADPYFRVGAPRCNDADSLVSAGCGQAMIQRQSKPVWEVLENRTLQDVTSESQEGVVQIQPQKLRVSLKPRETKTIKFSYRPAKNYPLDLYYLMDLTWSMRDDKDTLVSLGDNLLAMMKNLTDNYRIGFGSFADKPVMPYTYMDNNRRQNPCMVADENCDATYSFKHHLSLTKKVEEFIEKVNSSSVTANLDNAEAQLEALVQVVACSEVMGWAARSRKIVILLSDGLMHTAGDGKLGGTVLRNDEQCHLDDNGYYSEAHTYDYPSIAQVHRLLKTNKVNVIFAITDDVKRHYDRLHELLKDNTYVATLESDSANILKLVKMGYEDIVSVVDFKDNSNLGPIKVNYFTDCGVRGGQLIEATRCTGVEYGMTLNYEAHLTLNTCPEFTTINQTIHISESLLGQDSLSVEVEIQCGCECKSDQLEDMSLTCPQNSRRVCGVCQCNKGWMGPDCNCDIKDDLLSLDLISQCREPNATRTTTCSGAGDCICGKCHCDPGYDGRYCQCQMCDINFENGLECGGFDRGTCMCGKCDCNKGWSGEACDCPASNETCIAPASNQICFGRGDCVCGECICSNATYAGKYCESCPSCQSQYCERADECLSCYLNNSCKVTCTVNYYANANETTSNEENSNVRSCVLRTTECDYIYSAILNDSDWSIVQAIVIRNVNCPTITAKAMSAGFAAMGIVIAIGIIAIFMYKFSQVMADKRAYAKFYKEVELYKMKEQNLNPIYKSPISEFRLPDEYPRDKFE
ncbi:integrin beta-PS [Aphomia sociella]